MNAHSLAIDSPGLTETKRVMPMVLKGISWAILLPAIWSLASVARADQQGPDVQAIAEHCSTAEGLTFICGVRSAEDIIALDSSPWVIASSYVKAAEGLFLIHRQTGEVRRAPLAGLEKSPPPNLACRASLPDGLKTHGLALQTLADGGERLLVVNHGAEETIEVFDVDAGSSIPQLRWTGCIKLPKPMYGNSVVGLRDGSVIFSEVSTVGNGRSSQSNLLSGDGAGAVFSWRDGAVVQVRTPTISGPAGLALSADERWLFISSWAVGRVWRIDLSGQVEPQSVKVDFHPDNLRRDGDTVFAAGQVMELEPFLACQARSDRPAFCANSWGVATISTKDMTVVAQKLWKSAVHGDVTVASPVGDELWLGTVGETDKIAVVNRAHSK